jgi:hypothetical protein
MDGRRVVIEGQKEVVLKCVIRPFAGRLRG